MKETMASSDFYFYGNELPILALVDMEFASNAKDSDRQEMNLIYLWLLMIEKVLPKLSRELQFDVRDHLYGATLNHFAFAKPIEKMEPIGETVKLAQINVGLFYEKKYSVSISFSNLFPELSDMDIWRHFLRHSLVTIFGYLSNEGKEIFLKYLFFGLIQWEKKGLPGFMNFYYSTWNFDDPETIMVFCDKFLGEAIDVQKETYHKFFPEKYPSK